MKISSRGKRYFITGYPEFNFTHTALFKQMLEDFKLHVDDFTCTTCLDRNNCIYSYDPYNTYGDCLGLK